MSSDFLSQEEVDALLKGVAGEEESEPAASPETGVRPYSVGRQDRIVRARMPTLEMVNDRFARLLRSGLSDFVRRGPEITVGAVKVLKHSEFARHLAVPASLNVVHMKPLRGACLIVLDPKLVFAVIDNLFGGDGRFKAAVEGREFTHTEQRIIQKLLQLIFGELQKAWAQVHPVVFELARSESHIQFAGIAAPSDIVVASGFTVAFGDAGGQLQICIPYSTIEPIRDRLYSQVQGAVSEPDRNWMQMLSGQVQLAEVELVAQFARIPATLERVLRMRAGDVLDIEAPRSVKAEVDGVAVFECKYGSQNGRYAIRVERVLAAQPQHNQ